MCEPGESGTTGTGHKLRMELTLKRVTVAVIVTASLILFLGFLHGRLAVVPFWLGILAIAALALSVLSGCTVVERTAGSLRTNGDWPAESQVAGLISLQRGLICLGVLLTLAALITAVYLPASPLRPVRISPQPVSRPQTPMRPFSRGRMEQPQRDAQPEPTEEHPSGRLERVRPTPPRRGRGREPSPPGDA